MPDPVTGLIVGGTSLLGSAIQGSAAEDAEDAQYATNQAAQAEQRRQFDAIQKLLQPYVQSGTDAIGALSPYAQAGAPALAQQQALLGLGGPQAQQQAIDALQNSPGFMAMAQQGENAILQNASATGGLRGGNTQAALGQFRPQLLQQYIDQQYGRLGGLTALGASTNQNLAQLGQAAAAGTASAGMQSAANLGNLLGQQGAIQAGGQLAQGQALGSALSIPAQLALFTRGAGGAGGLIGNSPGAGIVSGGTGIAFGGF